MVYIFCLCTNVKIHVVNIHISYIHIVYILSVDLHIVCIHIIYIHIVSIQIVLSCWKYRFRKSVYLLPYRLLTHIKKKQSYETYFRIFTFFISTLWISYRLSRRIYQMRLCQLSVFFSLMPNIPARWWWICVSHLLSRIKVYSSISYLIGSLIIRTFIISLNTWYIIWESAYK